MTALCKRGTLTRSSFIKTAERGACPQAIFVRFSILKNCLLKNPQSSGLAGLAFLLDSHAWQLFKASA
jgi:hypothetical protein